MWKPLAALFLLAVITSTGSLRMAADQSSMATLPAPLSKAPISTSNLPSLTEGVFGLPTNAAAPVTNVPAAPITDDAWVFVVPHQDDEVLSMGATIAQATATGKPIYVYFSTLSASPVQIKAALKRSFSAGLVSKQDVYRSRAISARDALKALGVPSDHVGFPVGESDGPNAEGVPPANVSRLFDILGPTFPHATFVTMSWLDRHADHFALGYELDRRCTSGQVTRCLFTQSALYQVQTGQARIRGLYPVPTPPQTCAELSPELAHITRAAYGDYAPLKGWLATGVVSVPDQFDYFSTYRRACTHGSSATWENTAQQAEARAWLEKNQSASQK